MSFNFESIPEKKIDVAFEYQGQTLIAKIDVNKITQNTANATDYAFALWTFVESWDAKDKLTLGFLRGLPMTFLIAFFNKCMAEAFPKPGTAEA